ncbi:MAG: cobalamin-dependent protein [Candidatus Omnitrophota bacterium]|nr:cobalamin-dependent protein [Candidatus Omnitrophota bacterium]
MKVLLFNIPMCFNSWQNTEPPMSVSYLASILKQKGHSVKIKDFEVEKFTEQILLKVVEDFDPEMAGLSFRTPSFNSAKTICSILKQARKDLPVVLGGPHATAFAEDALKLSGADIAVRGEGEFALLEIAEAIEKGSSLKGIEGISFKLDGAINHNPERKPFKDIDAFPWPARELLPMDLYNIDVILSSRGCPFACIYCDKVISSRAVKYRLAEDVVNEIIYTLEKYGKPAFYFIDEHFLSNKDRANRMLDLLIKAGKDKGIQLKWVCQSRVDAIDEKILRKAKDAGCYEIHYGLETGDQTELAFINKRTTLEQARRAVEIAKECGLLVRGNFMIGFPISTKETISNTIRFAKSLPIDRYRFFIVSPLPNTKMWDYIITNNQLYDDFDWEKDHFLSPALNIPGFTKQDIVEYIGAAYLHTLRKDALREIFSLTFIPRIIKVAYLIIKTKKMRGNKLSAYFPKLTNLLLEIWLLIENRSLVKKLKFLRKISVIEKGLNKKMDDNSQVALAEEMKNFYKNSNVYRSELQTVANREHYEAYFKYVKKFAKDGSRMLDLGCGLGVVPYYFSLDGYDAYGVDVSLKFMSYSSHLRNQRLHYLSTSVFSLPFKDETFDVVGNYDVIEHIPDIEGFLMEGMRVLKKSGILVIICPSVVTPFTPLKAFFSFKKNHSIYTNKCVAFISIFINLCLVIKKKLSKKIIFNYRKPILDEMAWKRETDAVYCASPIDLKRFLESRKMTIVNYQNDGPSFLHKLVGRLLPDFASTVYLVAKKNG